MQTSINTIYDIRIRINFSQKNLLKRIHQDINLAGFGIQPAFAGSETFVISLLLHIPYTP